MGNDGQMEGLELTPKDESNKSIWALIAGLFTSPSETFEIYNKSPKILIPLILNMAVLSLFSTLTTPFSAKMQYEMMQGATNIPPAALEQMKEGVENPQYLAAAITALIMPVLSSLFVALLVWGIGSFIFGGQSKFKNIWGVTLMSGLIVLAGKLIILPMIFAKGSMLVSIGLTALLPGLSITSITFAVLQFLDVFVIWSTIVAGYGYAKALRISNGQGITASAIVTIGLLVIMIGLEYIGLKFAGLEMTLF